jgi:glutamyl-tRNA reductase
MDGRLMCTQERLNLLRDIHLEVERANMHGARFASLHEAYAVILEELDEVWDIARQKRRDRDSEALRKELIQIAAMAVKAVDSMDHFIGGCV